MVAIDAHVRTENGEDVELATLLGEPTLLVPVYYRCPNLCDLTLAGVAELVAAAPPAAQPEDVLIFSFAADETPADARAMRAMLAKHRPEITTDARWHFVSANAAAIDAVTRSIGFRFQRDPESATYSHVAGLVVTSADGRLRGFLPGVRFAAARLDAIVAGRAPDAAVASDLPQLLLWCFHYDPATGRYTLAIMRVLQLCGALSVVAILVGMLAMNRRHARRHGR
jgi:protein SCO1/2